MVVGLVEYQWELVLREFSQGVSDGELQWLGVHQGETIGCEYSGCQLSCGSNDSIGGCDDRHSHGVMLETKGVGETLTPCPFHDGADAAVVFQ
jgi:hypothetical protein